MTFELSLKGPGVRLKGARGLGGTVQAHYVCRSSVSPEF